MNDVFPEIEKLIGQGRNLEARNRAESALRTSNDLRLSQLYAMAVSKSGAPQTAMEFLEPVYRAHSEDPETAGILGGIYKEIFKKDQNTKYALLARDTYAKNYNTTKNYYTGINAATMSAIAGQSSKGREIANEIIKAVEEVDTKSFWELATLGEAWLLAKNREKAIDYYFQARKLAGSDWGKINSVFNQLWLLNHYVAVPNEVLKVFSPPGVAAFVGHMIDHPSRSVPRFPAAIEGRAKEAIASAIKTLNAKIGYTSLACGGDILFAESMLEAGGEVSAWLPFSKADFIETSLRFAGEEWVNRFNKLMDRAHITYITEEAYDGYDDLFSFQSSVIFGSAVIRSSMNHTKPTLLTLLSETDLNRKEGGTRDTIGRWPFADRHVNINPDNLIQGTALDLSGTVAAPQVTQTPTADRPVLYIVSADLPGVADADQQKIWSTLKEKMNAVVVAPVTFEPGEQLVASFSTIAGAMEFARLLMGLIEQYHRTPKLRICLFATPATLEPAGEGKRLTDHGHQRLRTIHTQVQPGTLYALARFASVIALDTKKYSMDYAGLVEEGPHHHEIYSVRINS